MAFRDLASRLLRRDWGDNVDALSEEVYAILASSEEITTGPISIDLRDPNSVSLSYESPPIESLNIPSLDLEAVRAKDVLASESISRQATSGGTVETRTIVKKFRTALIGRVVSYDLATQNYTMDLYPDGLDDQPVRVTKIADLQGTIVDPGVYAPAVYRVSQVQITKTSTIDAATNVTRSQSTQIQLLSRKHYVAFGQGAGAPLTARPPWGSGPNYNETPPFVRTIRAISYWEPAAGNIQQVYSDHQWAPNTTLAFSPTMPPPIQPKITFNMGGPVTLDVNASTNQITMVIPGFRDGCGPAITAQTLSMPVIAWMNSQYGLNWPPNSLAGTAQWHVPSCQKVPFTFTVQFRG